MMKQQTEEQAKVLIALKAARRYHAGDWGEAEYIHDLPVVFDAVDLLFSALSKAKQRYFAPPAPKKRGRPRTTNDRFIGYLLNRATADGHKWKDAVEIARST